MSALYEDHLSDVLQTVQALAVKSGPEVIHGLLQKEEQNVRLGPRFKYATKEEAVAAHRARGKAWRKANPDHYKGQYQKRKEFILAAAKIRYHKNKELGAK